MRRGGTVTSEQRPSPRPMDQIISDLRSLAQSDGALHEIASIIYRDWVLTIDTKEAKVTDDPSERWSVEKLNNNELMLLMGLCVQSPTDRTWSILPKSESFAISIDALFRELHDRINEDAPWINRETGELADQKKVIGSVAREAIYYGADGFYIHQFRELARHRFRQDQEWLLQNAGLSIRPVIDIANHIVGQIIRQMDFTGRQRMNGEELSPGGLFQSLLVSKADLRKRFGRKLESFLAKFSTPATNANIDFTEPFAVNAASIAPLIDLGDFLFVPNQYRLFQSVYESPFYWMIGDNAYRDIASRNRGKFLEDTTVHLLKRVFGSEHVHQNVVIYDGKNIAGEVDALVAYGEFVIVGQAKSKRVSLKARAGDRDALVSDFKGAIQDPYRQALECGELIQKGAKCITADGRNIDFPVLPRVFPMVVLSDHFPASAHLSGMLLERLDETPPVIWDLGFLDCVTRLLPTPVELIFYLQARSEHFDKVVSDSEFNFLGYHLRSKLALPDNVDFMMLERDFATIIDDYMIAADLGIQAERPQGVLEQLDIPVISELFGVLKNADPRLAGVVVDLYDFSGAALADLSATILDMRDEVRRTGKVLKAFSIQTSTGGLTYCVVDTFGPPALRSAHLIAAKHKYDSRSSRWYVIVDAIDTDFPVDALAPLIWPWVENEDEAVRAAKVGAIFKSRYEPRVVGEAAARRQMAGNKP